MSNPLPFKVALGVLIAVSFLPSEQAYSEEILRRSDINIELGLSTWISQADTKWSHNASSLDPSLGNPTSQLEYKDVWSNVVELYGQIDLRNGLFFRGQYGYGAINNSGTLNDDDFLAGQTLISETQSDIDGNHLWYVNADIGYKFLTFAGGKGSVKGFVGYQYWKEKYEAKGVTQLVCTSALFCSPVGTVSNVGQTVVTNEVQWNSIRVGVEGGYQMTRRFSIDGSAAFIPYTSLKNKDSHPLRTDLLQDPSFSMSGTGIGANFEVSASYMIVKQLFFDLGYRYWWLRVTDGNWQSHPVGGPTISAQLKEFQTIRQGVTLGLTYKF